jgi:hypothetical protein
MREADTSADADAALAAAEQGQTGIGELEILGEVGERHVGAHLDPESVGDRRKARQKRTHGRRRASLKLRVLTILKSRDLGIVGPRHHTEGWKGDERGQQPSTRFHAPHPNNKAARATTVASSAWLRVVA